MLGGRHVKLMVLIIDLSCRPPSLVRDFDFLGTFPNNLWKSYFPSNAGGRHLKLLFLKPCKAKSGWRNILLFFLIFEQLLSKLFLIKWCVFSQNTKLFSRAKLRWDTFVILKIFNYLLKQNCMRDKKIKFSDVLCCSAKR